MGRRIRRTNRRSNLRKARKSMKRKTMKRKTMKRKTMKRKTMKRINTYRKARKNKSYGGASVAFAPQFIAHDVQARAAEGAKYLSRRSPRGRTLQHPMVARREHSGSNPANAFIHGKTSSEFLQNPSIWPVGTTREQAYNLLYSVFWPELLREIKGLTAQKNTFNIQYKGDRYGAKGNDPMAHTWKWASNSLPINIDITYPTDSEFLADELYESENRFKEAIDCYKAIKSIEALVVSNKRINKAGSETSDHSYDVSGLETHLKLIVQELNALKDTDPLVTLFRDIPPIKGVPDLGAKAEHQELEKPVGQAQLDAEGTEVLQIMTDEKNTIPLIGPNKRFTRQVHSLEPPSQPAAIVIHDMNKNDIDDIWAILQCIISYKTVYLQETTDKPRCIHNGDGDNSSNAGDLRKELYRYAILHNCEIYFVSKGTNIKDKLDGKSFARIDCYYIAGLPDPSKNFGFEKLRDGLREKKPDVEINYIIQGKPPSLEKFDYLNSDLGIIELLHDSQKQTLGLSSNVRSGAKFAEINFPKGLSHDQINGMDEDALEEECRNIYDTRRIPEINDAMSLRRNVTVDEAERGIIRKEEMKKVLKSFYNVTVWTEEQTDWGATSGVDPGSTDDDGLPAAPARVAPNTESWIASNNYKAALAGSSQPGTYAVEINGKINSHFKSKDTEKMDKTSKALTALKDSLKKLTTGDNPINVYFYAKPKTSTPGYKNRLEISNKILMDLAETPLGEALNYRYIGGVDRQTPFSTDPRISDDNGKNTLADLEAVLWFVGFSNTPVDVAKRLQADESPDGSMRSSSVIASNAARDQEWQEQFGEGTMSGPVSKRGQVVPQGEGENVSEQTGLLSRESSGQTWM